MRKMILVNIAVLVVAAVGVAWWCDCRVRSEVDRAIAQREKEDFDFWRKRLIPVYEQAGVKGNGNPTTKAELFEPLIRSLESVGVNSAVSAPTRYLSLDEMVDKQRLKSVNVNAEDVPLCDMVDNVREETGWNIYVNWVELEKIGINRNDKVRLQMGSGTFENLLVHVWKHCTDQRARANPITYYIEDGVITITTQNDKGMIAPRPRLHFGVYNDV